MLGLEFQRRRMAVAGIALLLMGLAAWLFVAFALPWYHLRAARQALKQFRPEEARRHLAVCLAKWPQHSDVHFLAARAARLADDPVTAESQLDEAEQLERTEDCAVERAMLRAQNGDLDSVEAYLRRQVDTDHPDTIFILDAMVRGYARVYRFFLAQYTLKLWLDREPDSIHALWHRGQIWARLHNYQDAAEDFRRVLTIDAGMTEARLALANALLELAQPAEALEHLEQLREARPEDPQVLVRLACCQNTLNRPGEARVILDQVLAIEPDCTPALQGRAQVALQQGDAEEALKWAQKALDVDRHDYQANYLLYQCLKQCGKEKEAQAQFVKVERIKTNILRMQELGTKRLQAAPEDPALRYEMGMLSIEMGQEEVGLGWLLSAVQKAPDFKPAHAALADYYDRKGDSRRATLHRQQAS
jgi:tetratricopeptide (TPR) repeat protein